MCGIAGIVNLNNKPVAKNQLHDMDVAIRHRGPDSHGEFIDGSIGLANRRLAIIDPGASGKQPMSSKDGFLWITFNGEIFNYEKLRDDLIQKGYGLKSHTDTETILYAYAYYGEEFVSKLIGQFAFCIWDKKKNKVFIARDQLGVNPLYYAKIGETFLFASELKSIIASGMVKKRISPQALHHYLSMFTVPAPYTIIEGVYSLLPGHTLTIHNHKITESNYYKIPIGKWKEAKNDEDHLKHELREQLVSSVSSSLVSDVPVGAFLSGGIDSSTVVALSARQVNKPIKTFSLWSDGNDWYDERKYARMISQMYKTDHYEFTVTEKEVVEKLPEIVYFFDQPTGGSLEGYFISEKAANYVKVALSGLGGDELFGGYHSVIYDTERLARLYSLFPTVFKDSLSILIDKSPLSGDIKKTFHTADKLFRANTILDRRLHLYFAYKEKEKQELYSAEFLSKTKNTDTTDYFKKLLKPYENYHPVDQLQYIDLMTYTRDDLLLGMNMMSMATSLEARVPLLDVRLVEFASRVPPSLKYKKGISKYLLKEVAKEWLSPEIINHRKTGFGIPRVKMMKEGLKPYIEAILSKESIEKRGIFKSSYVEQILGSFYNSQSEKMLWSEHLRLWVLFIFEIWCRIYLDGDEIGPPDCSLRDICTL